MTSLPPTGMKPSFQGLLAVAPVRSEPPAPNGGSFGDLLAFLTGAPDQTPDESFGSNPELDKKVEPSPIQNSSADIENAHGPLSPVGGAGHAAEMDLQSELAAHAGDESQHTGRTGGRRPFSSFHRDREERLAAILSQLAKIFNEFGLFQGPAGLPWLNRPISGIDEATSGPVSPLEAAPRAELSTLPLALASDADPSAVRQDSLLPGSPNRANGPRLANGAPSRGARAAALRAPQRAQAALVLRPILEGTAAEPSDEPAPLEASHAPQASPIADGLEIGQSTEARVVLDVAENGLRLAARTARLSEDDKDRLRHEIASLLASHGFSASEIRLNGDDGKDSRPIQRGRS